MNCITRCSIFFAFPHVVCFLNASSKKYAPVLSASPLMRTRVSAGNSVVEGLDEKRDFKPGRANARVGPKRRIVMMADSWNFILALIE